MTKENLAQDFFKSDVDDYKKEHYGSGYRTFMTVRLDRFLEEIDSLNVDKETSTVLEAGCGPGYLTKALVDRDFDVSAMDISDEMLRLTRSWFENEESTKAPTALKQGSVEELPFDSDAFNLVVSAGVIEYLDTDDLMLAEAFRVLKPGGYLLLSVTNSRSPVGYLDFIVEAIKRNSFTRGIANWILTKLGRTPVRPRPFKVRQHSPQEFRNSMYRAKFTILREGFFYMLPWPHPFDRIFPVMTDKLGKKLESSAKGRAKACAEGFYIVAQKPE